MEQVRIKVDIDVLTVNDMIELEEFDPTVKGSLRIMRDILAKFVVDEQGNQLEPIAAQAEIGKLNKTQLEQVVNQVGEGLSQEDTDPK